jgi:epoxyqueuosine reductase QueG
MARDELFDAAACRRQMTRFDNVDAQICGICIAACPYTRPH